MTTTDINQILAERGARYGTFKNHAAIAQGIKAVMFGCNPNLELEADQRESLEMIAHKIARIINGDHDYADSWRDISGYASLVADRLDGMEK